MAALSANQLRHYLQRIELAPSANGSSPPPPPTLQTLCTVQWAHLKAIPFEALSLRLKAAASHPPSADVDAAFSKLVTARRGGWCFEQNAVFSAALRALGFTVYDGAARVARLDPPPGEAPPPPGVVPLTPHCSHRVAFVEMGDGLYLADVGFGGE
jgi:N-hydroxyarylamine O-acetyltransferase